MVTRTLGRLAAFLVACSLALPALAVDNPDAPDLAAQFEARAKPLQDRIGEASGGGRNLGPTTAEYDAFLERELNRAYSALIARLAPARLINMQHAQRRWLAWRDAEIEFINSQWTLTSAGSSSTLTRSMYRSALTKQRTLELLQYLREMPGPSAP
jgi:uncharacterized protein YecT (DUF1311 family)